jgi:Protein of unknown function (DUF1566)
MGLMAKDGMKPRIELLRWVASRRAMLVQTAQALIAGAATAFAIVPARATQEQLAVEGGSMTTQPLIINGDTITDTRTGFMWERKRESDAADWHESLHSVNAVLTWTEATGAWIEAVNESRFAGFSDWRVPTAHELVTIIDYARPRPPAIDPIFGPVASAFYWSSTPLSFRPGLAWDVFFLDGVVFVDDHGNGNRVRAVRTTA